MHWFLYIAATHSYLVHPCRLIIGTAIIKAVVFFIHLNSFPLTSFLPEHSTVSHSIPQWMEIAYHGLRITGGCMQEEIITEEERN